MTQRRPVLACPPQLEAAARRSTPRVALVLGSGLTSIAQRVHPEVEIPFADCPPMMAARVDGHEGQIILGDWNGDRVLVLSGRNHFYEGHAWDCVLAPLRLAAFLGASRLVLTNAAGGIRDDLTPGTLMAITQHLDWTRASPWKSRLDGTTARYSRKLREWLRVAAGECGVVLRQGSYAALLGPNYETPAEIRALRSLGVDAVGMSTAREVEAAAAWGLEVAAVSCITNRAAGLSASRLSHAEVLEVSRRQAQRMGDLLERLLARLRDGL